MINFGSFYGIITAISDYWVGSDNPSSCYKLMTVQNRDRSIVNFVITPTTYFVENTMVFVGDIVTGYYDANAPVPLIYPPQYQALVVAKAMPNVDVKVDYFNSDLISSDGNLKLNISPLTPIILENGQAFTGDPANHNLVVIYGPTTRSIPAITTPYKIVVICVK